MQEVHGCREQTQKFLTVLLPILVTQVSLMAPGFFNTVMAGHISKEDLAGVAVGASIFFPFLGAFIGIISGLTPIIAQYYGSGRQEAIRQSVQQGFFWSVILAIIFMGLGYIAIPWLLPMLSLDPDVEAITIDYLKYISSGLIPISLASVLRNLIDAHGKTKLTMFITVLIVPINIGLNYIFMYGGLGIEAFGGIGAGIGAGITYGVAMLLNIITVLWVKEFHNYEVFSNIPYPNPRLWLQHLKICLPIGATIFCEHSIFGAVGLFISTYGTTIMAAHQIALNFSTIIYMMPLSVSMALTILVAFEVGRKKYSAARAYIKLARVMSLAFVGSISLILYLWQDSIAKLYTADETVREIAKSFLVYSLFMQFADSVNAPLQGALRGYKDVTVTLELAFISFWVIGLPLGHMIARNTELGAYGYWWGLIVGVTIGAVMLVIRLHYVERRISTAGSML